MKTSHRKAARAKRYAADAGSMYRVMNRLQPFTGGEIAQLAIPMWQAWADMKNGSATDGDFHTLAAVVNVALVRAETVAGDVDELCVAMVKRAQDALMVLDERHKRLGRWGVCYQSLEHIPPALEFYQQVLELSTPLQMQEAMREVIRRGDAGEVIEPL